jgi:hypothetical protein
MTALFRKRARKMDQGELLATMKCSQRVLYTLLLGIVVDLFL